MMRISFAVLVIAALVTVGCMTGDDDDDDEFECDFGQHDNPFGPNSPMQEATQYGECRGLGPYECVEQDPALPAREIEWRCNCNPDSCERWKALFDELGVEY